MPAAETKNFPIQYGKYELLERIGEGGMAEVFRARLPGAAGFEKILVVKRILPHLASKPDFVRMFVDEAKLAAKVQHQNVVQVFELGEAEGGELYMAMEYIPGVDMRRLLVNARDRKLRIPVWFVLHTVSEVLSGLAYAHELCDTDGKPLHVVHRDVTPGNIFVSYQGEVKLADFGIAKAAGRVSETEAGQVKGNAPFMSPEAIYGRTLDPRADVFSAGVVLWAALALRLPFEGGSNYETAKLVCESKREPPSKFNPHVTAELDAVSLQALEIDRGRRIPSAREFQARILEILSRIRPKLLPQDVRGVVDVLLGRRAPDHEFRDPPRPPVELPRLTAPQTPSAPPPLSPQSAEILRSLSDDLSLGDGLVVKKSAQSVPSAPSMPAVAQALEALIIEDPEEETADFHHETPLSDLDDEPLDNLATHVMPRAPFSPPQGSMPSKPAVHVVPTPTGPIHIPPAMSAHSAASHATPLPGTPLPPLPSMQAAQAAQAAPVAPMYSATGMQPRAQAPDPANQGMVLRDVPLASIMEFMGGAQMPLVQETRDIDRFFNDVNPFYVQFVDGSVLTAKGVDECLSFCDPHGRNAVAVSCDRVTWIDIPTFARLCGFDYLAPDTSPPKNVKMIGQLEEKRLTSVFAQLARQRATGRLVIMDKGVTRVARREIDIVGGAPVYVYADHPNLQLPQLYIQHRLMKRELMPDLVVAAVKQQKPIEDLAKQFAFIDLNPYRPACMRDRLGELFTWRYGRYAFDAGQKARGVQPFAPSLVRSLPDAVIRGYSVDELRREMEPYMLMKLRRTDNFEIVLADLGLKDKQTQIARKLGQRAPLGQLLKKSPAEAQLLLTMNMILLDLEALSSV